MRLKMTLIITGAVLGLLILVAGARLGLLVRSLTTYKTYWQKEAARPIEPDELVYIALGDSAGQGIGATSPRRGYVGLFAKHLEEKTGKKIHVINISVSGDKLADAIKNQLPQLASLPKADYMTIEIGANDMATYNEETFKTEFAQILQGLPKDTYVANMPSFNGGRKGHVNPNAYAATQLINTLVGERSDLRLADLYSATVNQNIFDFGADLFHPDNSGYKKWAKAFINAENKVQ